VGSADEKDEEAGMCHFIERMIFKGTENRIKYSQEIQKIYREEVHQVAKKYFNLDAYALAIIRPQEGK
jgi:predicted Zn-dependent peptidase